MKSRKFAVSGLLATWAFGLCGTAVWANVYPSGLAVNASAFSGACGTVAVSYILNENANGDGTLPGVRIEVLDSTSAVIRTINIACQLKGAHAWQWDGRKDDGTLAPSGNYSVRITAADVGHTTWDQISDLDVNHSFYFARSVAINKNPASLYYGRVYVGESQGGTTSHTPFPNRTTQDGVYGLNADGSQFAAANPNAGGVNWAIDGSKAQTPFKVSVGYDDAHVYVSYYWTDDIYDFAPDLSSPLKVTSSGSNNTYYGITAGGLDMSQWSAGAIVTGSQAAGNRVLYSNNPNYDASTVAPYTTGNRRGIIKYDLAGQPAATSGDKGTQFIGPPTYFGNDFDRDIEGNTYYVNSRSKTGDAPAVEKYNPSGVKIATFNARKDKTNVEGVGVCEVKNWVAVCGANDTAVWIFDRNTGADVVAVQTETSGNLRDVAFDAVGNLYVVCPNSEWLKVFSPPDGANHSSTTTAAFAVTTSGSGGPVITSQPQDAVCCTSGTNNVATFHVAATGADTLTYQWQKNGANLTDGGSVSGSTTDTLTLTGPAATDTGSAITVKVCDSSNLATISNVALLTVGPTLQHPPFPQKGVCAGSNVTYSVLATGNGALSYQWQKDTAGNNTFADIAGATGTSVTLTNVASSDTKTQVRCVLTDSCGSQVISPPAILIVAGALAEPAVYFAVSGGVGSTVTVNCQPLSTMADFPHYQWSKAVRTGRVAIGTDACTLRYVVQKCDNWYVDGTGTKQLATFYSNVTSCGGSREGYRNTVSGNAACTLTVTTGGPVLQNSVALCSNGTDDDCSGLVDCANSTCINGGFCCNPIWADAEGGGQIGVGHGDGDVDQDDFGVFEMCFTGDSGSYDPAGYCRCFDKVDLSGTAGADGHISAADLTAFENCAAGSGPGIQAISANCP